MILRYSMRLMDEKGDADGGGSGTVAEPTSSGGLLTNDGATVVGSVDGSVASESAAKAPQVSIPENWKEALPLEMRDDVNLKPIHDLPSLVKSFIHSQKMIGRDKVQLPDKHATDEDWSQFYQKIGQPKTLEDYQIEIPKDAQFEDGFVSQLKEVAFKSGILPRQLNPLVQWYAKANQEAMDNLVTKHRSENDKRIEELKREWGSTYAQKIQLAKQALKATNIEDVNSWLDDAGLSDDARLIKILSTLGEMLKEDVIPDTGGQPVTTPKEVQAEINEIMGNLKHPYYDGAHPNHKQAIDHVLSLFEKLHPKQEGVPSKFGLT